MCFLLELWESILCVCERVRERERERREGGSLYSSRREKSINIRFFFFFLQTISCVGYFIRHQQLCNVPKHMRTLHGFPFRSFS